MNLPKQSHLPPKVSFRGSALLTKQSHRPRRGAEIGFGEGWGRALSPLYDKLPPVNFSRITDDLFIGDTPRSEDYELLRGLGVRLVINMRFEWRPPVDPHQPPLNFLWLRTIDSPLLLIPIRSMMRGARAALNTIREGGRVYTHCAKGRHRGVAMGAAVLIALGYDPFAAIDLIKRQRPDADPDIFYIRSRILRFARTWSPIPVEDRA